MDSSTNTYLLLGQSVSTKSKNLIYRCMLHITGVGKTAQ